MIIKKIKIKLMNIPEYHPRQILKQGDIEYDNLKKSIDKYGNVCPIIWNEQTGNIVSGVQRLSIITENKITETDVVVVNLSLPEEKVLNIALNKIDGQWDKDKLKDIFEELENEMDLSLTGFDEMEIESLLQDMEYDLDDFFEDEKNDTQPSKVKEINCPNCGNVIEI